MCVCVCVCVCVCSNDALNLLPSLHGPHLPIYSSKESFICTILKHGSAQYGLCYTSCGELVVTPAVENWSLHLALLFVCLGGGGGGGGGGGMCVYYYFNFILLLLFVACFSFFSFNNLNTSSE